MPATMGSMEVADYDLWCDANSVACDLIVETWISLGPRALDPSFDPHYSVMPCSIPETPPMRM
jgi:hypothetical protein